MGSRATRGGNLASTIGAIRPYTEDLHDGLMSIRTGLIQLIARRLSIDNRHRLMPSLGMGKIEN